MRRAAHSWVWVVVALGACLPPRSSLLGKTCLDHAECGDGAHCASGICAEGPPVVKVDRWETATPLPQGRAFHQASKLSDGRVVVTGGVHAGAALSTTVVFDPATGKWASGPAMRAPRSGHAQVVLADGSVLVVGGFAGTPMPGGPGCCERLDSSGSTWTPLTELGGLSPGVSLQRVGNGALVLGLSPDAGTQRFEPSPSPWRAVGASARSYRNAASAVLADGGVYAVTGAGGERFDANSEAWSAFGAGSTGVTGQTASVLRDGTVLVLGGSSSAGAAVNAAQRLTPVSLVMTAIAPMRFAHSGHTASRLVDGRVLVVGGSPTVGSAELFDSELGWSSANAPAKARRGHTATVLDDGSVLVVGGAVDGGAELDTVERYLP